MRSGRHARRPSLGMHGVRRGRLPVSHLQQVLLFLCIGAAFTIAMLWYHEEGRHLPEAGQHKLPTKALRGDTGVASSAPQSPPRAGSGGEGAGAALGQRGPGPALPKQNGGGGDGGGGGDVQDTSATSSRDVGFLQVGERMGGEMNKPPAGDGGAGVGQSGGVGGVDAAAAAGDGGGNGGDGGDGDPEVASGSDTLAALSDDGAGDGGGKGGKGGGGAGGGAVDEEEEEEEEEGRHEGKDGSGDNG
ncbi:unnamed protein product, partial [Pylaiella littoralis]